LEIRLDLPFHATWGQQGPGVPKTHLLPSTT
jgi:hypothetical protein